MTRAQDGGGDATSRDTRIDSTERLGEPPRPGIAADASLRGTMGVGDAREFFLVGIGASAGGLEALELFFSNMPADSGMAFVVVQHLSPDYKSLMAELLSRRTSIPVFRVEDGTLIEPNNIYLIPPKKYMTVFQGRLFLSEQETHHTLKLPINVFFRSMAEDFGDRSIAVVLSGTGSDGTLGIRDVKGAGGMIMVQDEESARFDGMPRSALVTGLVDYSLPPEKMPEQLLSYVKNPFLAEAKADLAQDHEDVLTKIIALLRSHTGVDFTHYKRSTIVRRIQRRVGINQIDRLDLYLRYLKDNPEELTALYRDLLIGVTNFFRDPASFDAIRDLVITPLIESKDEGEPIRIWVAGCATGEEAYSIAMLVHEGLERAGRNNDVKIFATDIDREAILRAGEGVYPQSLTADVSPERLRRFFTHKGDKYRLTDRIRKMIIFSPHDITKDPPFSKMDMVSCRNLLIYLNPVAQRRVLALLQFALREDGYLVLGPSESIGEMTEVFETTEPRHRIFRSKGRHKGPVLHHLGVVEGPARDFRGRGPAARRAKDPHADALEKIFKDILSDYYPPFLTVDTNHQVMHLFGDCSRYLKLPQGRMAYSLREMIREDLSVAVTTALQKAINEKRRVVYEDVRLEEGDDVESIDLVVHPVLSRGKEITLIFVGFEPRGRRARLTEIDDEIEGEKFDLESKAYQRITDLEQDLQHTRESLQATIEELETSNEELQATNEELLAANEELQSTNEELQSVNEELYTVNAEYQQKIRELSELNSDMDNLLRSTEIGTIFLDRDLCVRKFTPAAAAGVHLLESDIGRPLHHISHDFEGAAFIEDARSVLATNATRERTLRSGDGRWFFARTLPYRDENDATRGVVITLVDITEEKQTAQNLHESRHFVERSWTVLPGFTYIFSLDTQKTIFVSPSISRVLGLSERNVVDGTTGIFHDLLHEDDRERVTKHHEELGRIADDEIREVDFRLKSREGKWVALRSHESAFARDESGGVVQVIGTAIVVDTSS